MSAHRLIQENKQTKSPFLDLGDCNLMNLPEELFKLTWLVDLNLGNYYQGKSDSRRMYNNSSGNRLIYPHSLAGLSQLTQLRTLNLSSNYIKDIRFLEKLTQLQHLDLSFNQIEDIQILEKLTQLQSLDLRSNRIQDIRPLKELTQLQWLHLSSNPIRDHSFLEKLIQLQKLYLDFNQIEDIQFLRELTQLHVLILGSNQIKDIRFLEKLTQLQVLYLSDNQIEDIRFLEKLTQLQSLYLNENQIREFPEQLIQAWPSLNELYLNSNPIENVPKEYFYGKYKNSISDIGGYFASLQQGSLKNDEVKLIVVGNTTAGKTSLMQFLREGKYEQTQNSTHGIALQRWPLPEINLRVNVWDFGGQEYYHATHRLFLDDHAIYIVVWEAKTNKGCIVDTDIYLNGKPYCLPLEHFSYSYWLDSIRYFAPNSTILLVQSKIDQNDIQNVSDDYFKPIYSVTPPAYYLSIYKANEQNDNPDSSAGAAFRAFKAELLEKLQADAAKYKLGKGWVAIRDAIRQLPKTQRRMSFNEFRDFCQQAVATAQLQFDADVEMSGLLTYLSGAASTIVYYADDSHLRDIVFLNPQWVTDTIYDILSYDIREKRENPGEFNRDHVERVLNQKGINELTDAFLELMKRNRFELIFDKPNCPDEYIAPQYLPDTPGQKHVDQYRRKTQHTFTLHFPRFLPRSVFLRFMVRYGDLAKEIYWKYGIVLEKPEGDIFVESLFRERKIRAAIEGNSKSKYAQELFDELWHLSDRKAEVELSVNETDFVEIGELKDVLADAEVTKIKSKQGKHLYVKDFFHLLGKGPISIDDTPVEPKTPLNKMPESATAEIFFSYAWGDESETGESREKTVDELYGSLEKDGFRLVRDKKDLGYTGLISGFMQRIGRGQIVIVVISDKYMKSSYCMFELYEIFRNSRLEKQTLVDRIFPIRVGTIDLSPLGRAKYREHWKLQKEEWDKYIRDYPEDISPKEREEYGRVKSITTNLGDFFEILSDINSLNVKLLSADNFAQIKEAIKQRINSSNKD